MYYICSIACFNPVHFKANTVYHHYYLIKNKDARSKKNVRQSWEPAIRSIESNVHNSFINYEYNNVYSPDNSKVLAAF